jgi:hypothetical protein
MLFYQGKCCIDYQLFACSYRSISSGLVFCRLICCVIVVVKSNIPWFIQDRRAINKPTRIKEINRNRLVFPVEIEHLMFTGKSILKRELTELFTANFRIKFELFGIT